MQRIIWAQTDEAERTALLTRPAWAAGDEVIELVADCFDRVRREGDAAVIADRARFDGVKDAPLKVNVNALGELPPLEAEDSAAIKLAAENIRRFHEAGLSRDVAVETMPGVRCERISRPIDRVGLYVPGGSAPLVSTLLMLAVPARLAGVGEIILATPPRGENLVEPAIAQAARIAGIGEIFLAGGAAAIAAMAIGTESMPRVDKIFGPGNIYVSEAKRQAAAMPGGPAIDLPAGPSEVMVIADAAAEPEFVAADLLAQAEHDAAAQVLLVTPAKEWADAVNVVLRHYLMSLPRREIIEEALKNARCLIVESLDTAVEIANRYAPEHLILAVDEPRALAKDIRNAGALFLGSWSPEALGDYAAGPNHVLPTGGAARAYGGLTVAAFQKQMTLQEVSPQGLEQLAPVVQRLARLEGLDAHALSVSLRAEKLEKTGALA